MLSYADFGTIIVGYCSLVCVNNEYMYFLPGNRLEVFMLAFVGSLGEKIMKYLICGNIGLIGSICSDQLFMSMRHFLKCGWYTPCHSIGENWVLPLAGANCTHTICKTKELMPILQFSWGYFVWIEIFQVLWSLSLSLWVHMCKKLYNIWKMPFPWCYPPPLALKPV